MRLLTTNRGGFTLVELLIVVAISAILAAVAVPAYVNYVHRAAQNEATSQLLTARLEMEEFFAENARYTGTIGCLPTFGNDACIANCGACSTVSSQLRYYTFSVPSATTAPYYRISAARSVAGTVDQVIISANTDMPEVRTPDALGFSVFSWLFH